MQAGGRMSFLTEVRWRKVFQVAGVYAVVAWLLVQIVTTVSEELGLPEWLDPTVIVLLAIGFPIALIMAWAFDLTPDGIVPDQGAKLTTQQRGRRIETVLVVLLIVAVGWIVNEETNLIGIGGDPVMADSIAVLPC